MKNGPGRLKKLTIDKGLLRETETVQEQIRTLLRADVRRPSQYTIETLLMELDVGEP